MSISIVQRAHTVWTGGNGTISFPAPTTAGNVVVLAFAWGYFTGGSFTFNDDAGNLVLCPSPRGFNGANCQGGSPVTTGSECWIAVVADSATRSNFCLPMQTITAVMGVPVNVSAWLFEVAGLEKISFPAGTLYEEQLLAQNTSSTQSGGQIATTTPEAPVTLTDPFNKFGTSDPLREYFLISVVAPMLTPDITGVSAGWTLEPVQLGFGCATQISPSGFDPVTQKATYTNSSSVQFGSVWEALRAPVGAPPPPTGNIVIRKVTSPAGSIQNFTFRPSYGSVFTLGDGQSNTSVNLPPGTYSITEDTIPGWNTLVTGGNASSIVLAAGQTITLTFTNSQDSQNVCYADGIIPTGAINGVNTSYTLPSTPNPPGSLILESDSSILAPGAGFTLSFVLNGTQLSLVYPPKDSLVAWYRINCAAGVPPLYKLVDDQGFDDNAFTSVPTVINSTYFTYGFVNSAKSAQNPLLGFHRKRYQEIQINVRGAGQMTVETFPNYILKQNLSYNPSAYVLPPIVLQTDPPDDLVRPLNSVGNRVYVMFTSSAIGAYFHVSKTIMVGVMDAFNVVNPNAG